MAPPVLRVQWDRATARAGNLWMNSSQGHATQKKAGRFASCPKQKLFYVFSSATIFWRCKNYVHTSTSTFFSVAPDHQTTPTPPIKVLDRSNKYICMYAHDIECYSPTQKTTFATVLHLGSRDIKCHFALCPYGRR